jgi:hypothetical protein
MTCFGGASYTARGTGAGGGVAEAPAGLVKDLGRPALDAGNPNAKEVSGLVLFR